MTSLEYNRLEKFFKIKIVVTMLILISLGVLGVDFFGGDGCQFDAPFKFQEELIQYQYNFIQLLKNLFRGGCK